MIWFASLKGESLKTDQDGKEKRLRYFLCCRFACDVNLVEFMLIAFLMTLLNNELYRNSINNIYPAFHSL